MGRGALLTVAAGALGALASAAPAQDAGRPLLSADTHRAGRIAINLADVEGSHGVIYERVGERRIPIGELTVTGPEVARLPDALTWSCTRRTRRLAADVTRPDGTTATATFVVRTPSCRDRLELEAPRSAPPGSRVAVAVTDRWALGDVTPRLCVRSPAGHAVCRAVRFGAGARAERRFRITRDGRWGLDLALGRIRTRATIAAGLAPGERQERPTLLVTGDSTAQGLEVALGDRLRRSVELVADFRPGTAIGHDWDRWPRIAAGQAARYRPRVTVISIGATEGYPMQLRDGTTVPCCEEPWRAEYVRRAQAAMRSFTRGGRGYGLWLTLPAPEDPRRAAISAVINEVTARAAAAVPNTVVVRIDRVLSPGWRFRRVVRYQGRRRVVRMPDGIHLTPAGAAIATDVVLRALSRLPWASTPGRR